MVCSGSSPASDWKVRAGWSRQSQCHQRGLASRSAPDKLRTTIVRVSLCRRGTPQCGQAACLAIAAATCCPATVSCTAASRSFASASCRPRVSGARSPWSRVSTSRITGETSVSSSGCTITCTLIFIRGSPQGTASTPTAAEILVTPPAVETLQGQQRGKFGQLLATVTDVCRVAMVIGLQQPADDLRAHACVERQVRLGPLQECPRAIPVLGWHFCPALRDGEPRRERVLRLPRCAREPLSRRNRRGPPPARPAPGATSPGGRQLVRRNAPMAAMESSCIVMV